MFKRLTKTILGMPDPFDPSCFGDPIAQKTEWTPIWGSMCRRRMHHLVQVTPDRLAFKLTKGAIVFSIYSVISWVVFTIGLVLGIRSDLSDTLSAYMIASGAIWVIVYRLGFNLLGYRKLWFSGQPGFFDTQEGWYWASRDPMELGERDDADKVRGVPLDRIHALQILKRPGRGFAHAPGVQELNLVIEDATRLPLLGHSNVEAIAEEAQQLAEFLNVPLWDAS